LTDTFKGPDIPLHLFLHSIPFLPETERGRWGKGRGRGTKGVGREAGGRTGMPRKGSSGVLLRLWGLAGLCWLDLSMQSLGWRLFLRYLPIGGSDNGRKATKQAGSSPFAQRAATPRASTGQILQARCMRYLRALAYVFNAHTLIVLLIANISVYVCLQADFRWNMDFSLVATGTIFPLTYTISQAYSETTHAYQP